MDSETSLHWGTTTLEGIFIIDILARYWGIPISLLVDSGGEMIYTLGHYSLFQMRGFETSLSWGVVEHLYQI